ncbi:GAP family protein [Geodermatophilus sp. SYSU D00814]
MGEELGQLLPYAVGVAISPVPVIAVILMLLAPHARGASAGFLLGWVAGIVVVTTLFVLLAGVVEPADGGPSPLVSWVKVVLGGLLLAAGVAQFRARPHRGEQPALPRWMSAIDEVTTGRALGLGAVLSGINPKNLGLCLAAGSTVGSAGLGAGGAAVAVGVYTVLAASTVAVPVLAYAVAAERMRKPLDGLHGWLVQENTVIMGTLLTVMGAVVAGHGIAGVAA